MPTPPAEKPLNEQWLVLRQLLPPGWEEQARRSGALLRARGVRNADDLLRTLLIHLAAGHSLLESAVRARRAGLAQLSSVALSRLSQLGVDFRAKRAWRRANLFACNRQSAESRVV